MEQYEVAWTPTAKRALQRLPEKVATAAVEFVYGPLSSNPQSVGKALRFEPEGLHGVRRGDYWIIHRINHRVTIIAIKHRSTLTTDAPEAADACVSRSGVTGPMTLTFLERRRATTKAWHADWSSALTRAMAPPRVARTIRDGQAHLWPVPKPLPHLQ